MICNKCGAQLEDDALFCENCGQKVEPKVEPKAAPVNGPCATKFCRHCGKPMPADAAFCPACGGNQNLSPNARPVAKTNTVSNVGKKVLNNYKTMETNKKIIITVVGAIALVAVIAVLFVNLTAKPIVGTWTDGSGQGLVFNSNGSFKGIYTSSNSFQSSYYDDNLPYGSYKVDGHYLTFIPGETTYYNSIQKMYWEIEKSYGVETLHLCQLDIDDSPVEVQDDINDCRKYNDWDVDLYKVK